MMILVNWYLSDFAGLLDCTEVRGRVKLDSRGGEFILIFLAGKFSFQGKKP